MGKFRDNQREFGGRDRGSSRFGGGDRGGSRFGGRGGGDRGFGGRDRDSGRGERRPMEMHNVICNKCGKRCEVPFKPTGSKPVFCSECFRQNEGSGNGGFNSRSFGAGAGGQGGMSSEQFKMINEKLDKILRVLRDLEIDNGEEEEEFEEEPEEAE